MKRTLTAPALLAALLVLAAVAVPARAATVTETVEKSFPLGAKGSFTIDNVNGAITVQSWDKEELKIVAVKTVKAATEEKAREALAKLQLTFKADGKSVAVAAKYPEESFWTFGWLGGGTSREISFAVMAPRGVKMGLQSVNGAVTVEAPGSDVTAETVNGRIDVSGAALLSATTVNGKVHSDVESLRSVETTNGAIEGIVRAARPEAATVETVNGAVILKFPAGASFRLDAENVNGSIDSEFPGLEGGKHSKGGDVNGGGNPISVEAVNGSITVAKL